jgi:hypothetical protein
MINIFSCHSIMLCFLSRNTLVGNHLGLELYEVDEAEQSLNYLFVHFLVSLYCSWLFESLIKGIDLIIGDAILSLELRFDGCFHDTDVLVMYCRVLELVLVNVFEEVTLGLDKLHLSFHKVILYDQNGNRFENFLV